MHAHPNIRAIAEPKKPARGSIAAAMATPDFTAISPLSNKAGLDPQAIFTGQGGPVTVGALDSLLAKVMAA